METNFLKKLINNSNSLIEKMLLEKIEELEKRISVLEDAPITIEVENNDIVARS